jgi:hypothetical protein
MTMRKTTALAAIFAAMGLGFFSSDAHAQDAKKEKEQGYSYIFGDEALLGHDLKDQGIGITVRPTGMRDRLLRPRVQFVAEMIKSVEAL